MAGRYRLISALGNGGMGTVWLAEDELLARQVAVKEVSPPADMTQREREMLRERTLREARTAARLSHPNVVAIYDVVEDDGRPWIVMELVPSRSLRDVVQERGPLTAQQAARVGLQVLTALNAAHALGIMHRDVKPGNVLIDATGRAVLADFGIARTQDSPTLTTSGMIVGSPSYIAPERARGERGGPESDLWSLGATLYALVEGRPAYDRAGALPTLMAVVNEDPDPPSLAGALWPVIRGLLDHVPSRRLGSADAERMLRQIAGSGGEQERAALLEFPPEGIPRAEFPPSALPGAGADHTRPVSSLESAEHTRTLRPWDAELPAEPDPPALPEPDPPALPAEPDPDVLPHEPHADALPVEPDPGAFPAGPDPGALPHEPHADALPVGPDPGAFPAGPDPGALPHEPDPGPLAGQPDPDAIPEEPAPNALPGEPAAGTLPHEPDPGALPAEPAPDPVPRQSEPEPLPREPDPGALPEDPDPGALPAEPDPGALPDPPEPHARPGESMAAVPPEPRAAADVTAAGPVTIGNWQPGVAEISRPPRRKQRTWALAAAAALVVVTGVIVAMVVSTHHPALATADPDHSASHPASSHSTAPGSRKTSAAPATSQPASPSQTPGSSTPGSSTPGSSTPGSSTPGSSTPGSSTPGPAAIPAGYHGFRNSTGFSIAVPNGWRVSHQGHYVYLVPPSGAVFLLIDQSDHPQPNPLADWQQQAANRESTYPGYIQIRLEAVHYAQAEKAADWEFTYYRQGVLTHVLNRNILANAHHAYALYWSTPENEWGQSWHIFKVLAQTFRPAAP